MQSKQTATDPKIILVVDDDVTSRLILREVLWADGFEVVEASDGAEAVTMFAEKAPSLVLLDIEMPGMNGLEACERMQASAGSRETVNGRLGLFFTAGSNALQNQRL